MLEVSGLPTWSARESTRSNFYRWGEVVMNSGIRVVKREEREAANSTLVADDVIAAQRSTPEMIVKRCIAASRERRQLRWWRVCGISGDRLKTYALYRSSDQLSKLTLNRP